MNIKFLLLGGPAVGKSSFLNKYIYQIYTDKYQQTLNNRYGEKSIIYNKQKIELVLWDISSKELSNPYHRIYYYGVKFALIFIDLTNKESLNDAIAWKKKLENDNDIQIILIANKSDLKSDSTITNHDLKKFVKENYFDCFFVISVKKNINIDNVINYLISSNKKSKQKKYEIDVQI